MQVWDQSSRSPGAPYTSTSKTAETALEIAGGLAAAHAYMRDYQLIILADCTASNEPADNENALRQMQQVLKADTQPSGDIDFSAYCKRSDARAA